MRACTERLRGCKKEKVSTLARDRGGEILRRDRPVTNKYANKERTMGLGAFAVLYLGYKICLHAHKGTEK